MKYRKFNIIRPDFSDIMKVRVYKTAKAVWVLKENKYGIR
jgi:hypothetical protein